MGVPTMGIESLEGPSALAGGHPPVRTTETADMEGLERQRSHHPGTPATAPLIHRVSQVWNRL